MLGLEPRSEVIEVIPLGLEANSIRSVELHFPRLSCHIGQVLFDRSFLESSPLVGTPKNRTQ